MTHVIAQPCIGEKDASCIDVCPVECIHPMHGDRRFEQVEQLYIDPDECIDCGLCVPECPVDAIFPAEELPPQWRAFEATNAKYFERKHDEPH